MSLEEGTYEFDHLKRSGEELYVISFEDMSILREEIHSKFENEKSNEKRRSKKRRSQKRRVVVCCVPGDATGKSSNK